jgi:hypothetical protein
MARSVSDLQGRSKRAAVSGQGSYLPPLQTVRDDGWWYSLRVNYAGGKIDRMHREPRVYPEPGICTGHTKPIKTSFYPQTPAAPPLVYLSVLSQWLLVGVWAVRSWYLYECMSIIISSWLLVDWVCASLCAVSLAEEFLQFVLCLAVSVCCWRALAGESLFTY